MFRIGLRLGCPKKSSLTWAVTFQCARNKKRALVFDGSNFPNKFSPKKKSPRNKKRLFTLGSFFLGAGAKSFFFFFFDDVPKESIHVNGYNHN